MFEKINIAWNWLEGKKSVFFAFLSSVAVIANILGYINNDQLHAILLITGSGFAAAMADKGNRLVGLLRDLKVLNATVPIDVVSVITTPNISATAPAAAVPSQPVS